MVDPASVPDTIDIDTPSPARMYDFYIGGGYNFESDRKLARQVMQLVPEVSELARSNKAFLRRAVDFCAAQGIRQFLDVGCGITSAGSTHEIAERRAPEVRTVYVDIEPVAVAHSEHILRDNDRALVIAGDARHPDSILGDQRVRSLLDLDKPVTLVMGQVLPWIQDSEDPAGLVQRWAAALTPGSYLVLSQVTDEALDKDVADRLRALYQQSITPVTPRSLTEFASWFELAGLDVVEPGVVFVANWRPEEGDEAERHDLIIGGVGRIPERD